MVVLQGFDSLGVHCHALSMVYINMSIRQSTSHDFYMDVMNVMYFEHDRSIYIDDSDDNSLQIHGVSEANCIQLIRNMLCCREPLDIAGLSEHAKSNLFEIYTAINIAREKGELGNIGSSLKHSVVTED